MVMNATHGELCTESVRVFVYDYDYEVNIDHARPQDADVLALFAAPPRGATVSLSTSTVAALRRPLGQMMMLPAGSRLEAVAGAGAQRLATFSMLPGLLPMSFDSGDPSRIAMCSDVQDRNLRLGMQRLAREALAPGFASQLLADGLALAMQVDLARYFEANGAKPAGRGTLAPWQMRRIQSYASETRGAPIRVAELAAEVGISPGHLMRAFRQTTGQTVHEFVEQMRVARSEALLRDPNKAIKQIAAELGFGSPSSFALAFRRATGRSPADFRKQQRRATALD